MAGGILYEIAGTPIGEGGGSIIYPVRRYLPNEEKGSAGSYFLYVLKECYPVSPEHVFTRNDYGEIVPEDANSKAVQYLSRIKEHQLAESKITGQIYSTGFRLTPVLETFYDKKWNECRNPSGRQCAWEQSEGNP